MKSLLVALRAYLGTPCVNRDTKVLCKIYLSAKDVPWGLSEDTFEAFVLLFPLELFHTPSLYS